jgi:hypothetical protein
MVWPLQCGSDSMSGAVTRAMSSSAIDRTPTPRSARSYTRLRTSRRLRPSRPRACTTAVSPGRGEAQQRGELVTLDGGTGAIVGEDPPMVDAGAGQRVELAFQGPSRRGDRDVSKNKPTRRMGVGGSQARIVPEPISYSAFERRFRNSLERSVRRMESRFQDPCRLFRFLERGTLRVPVARTGPRFVSRAGDYRPGRRGAAVTKERSTDDHRDRAVAGSVRRR